MKVAIFENQFGQVQTQFDIVKNLFFDNKLEYIHFNSSQEIGDINKISDYDLAVIDISLSSSSDKDGYNLISEILKLPKHPKIIILTGNSKIEEGLKERNLPALPIIKKPVDALDIRDKFLEVLR